MKGISLIVSLLVLATLAGACGGTAPEQVTSVKFMLDWVPNTNHTGVFVARDMGYFEEAGLDVEIIEPGEVYPEAAVASGAADFGISFQESVTLARAEDAPLVSIAAVLQHNTSGFASLATLNIASPADFEGLKYGAWGSPSETPVLKALMECAGADFGELQMVTTGFSDSLALISQKQVDLVWIYYGWEGIQAKEEGIDLNVVMMKDYFDCVPDFYTPVVITNESTIANRPEVIKSLLEALSRGYTFAAENPDEAADILITAVPELDNTLVKESQKWVSEYYIAESTRWGEQKESIWHNYADWMLANDIIKREIDFQDAFTNVFLP